MTYRSLLLALLLLPVWHAHADWFFRGTPNGWATTAMTSSDGVRYCTRQSFGSSSPRFKVDRFGDWKEAYPTADYSVAANTTYDICFNVSNKQFDVKIAASDTNQPPVAVVSPAGPATIKVGESISLSGSGSSDPDGSVAGYQWSTGATSASTSFSSATAGSFTVTLTVTDDKGVKASRSITITVNPASDTGQWFFRGTPNGWATTAMTSSDGVRYCTRQSFGSSSPRFKVDRFGDWKEAYPTADYSVAANTTYDICFNSSSKQFDVKIAASDTNQPPVAVISPAGPATIKVGESISLSGSGSSDPDGTIASYQWSTGATTASTSFSSATAGSFTV
ncbi:MAG: PKD domain-containing protein, partial [Corallincola sp.]|nr:PKD domain-containing protein [Corallincola sp.]